MILPALVLYIVAQIAIAAWAARGTASEDDYLVAGRGLGTWQVAFSIFATWFAAETVIATSAEVAADGLAGARVEPFGYGLGILVLGLFVAARLRRGGHLTVAGFLGSVFGPRVQLFAAILIALSGTVWAGAQLNALSVIIGTAAGLPFTVALGVSTALVITYTWIGGLKADVATDVLQGGIIILGLIVLLALLVIVVGGPDAALAAIPERGFSMRKPGETLLERAELWLLPVFGTIVAQEAISRLLAARTPAIARRGALVGAVIYLGVGMIPVTLGLIGMGTDLPLAEGDAYFASLAAAILPAWLFVIISGALVSAILSSVDSALLAVSAVTTEAAMGQDADPGSARGRLRLARLVTTAAGVIAALIAVSGESLREIVLTASGIGGLIAVPLVAALWLPRKGPGSAALAAMAVSLVLTAVLDWMLGIGGAFLYALAAGAAVFLVVLRVTRWSA